MKNTPESETRRKEREGEERGGGSPRAGYEFVTESANKYPLPGEDKRKRAKLRKVWASSSCTRKRDEVGVCETARLERITWQEWGPRSCANIGNSYALAAAGEKINFPSRARRYDEKDTYT